MKRLFLASSFSDVANLFVDFQKEVTGKTVTFIPTASKVEKVHFFVRSGKKALEKMGLVVDELEISNAAPHEITAKIQGNDFIYVTGGNTFFLLQELKRTGADQIIADAVRAGKLYIGESAGAIITAANIEYAKGMDSEKKAPNLENFDALHLVDFYTVPHHTNAPFKKAVEKILDRYSTALKLMPISNHHAIWVEENEITIKKNETSM